MEIFILSQSKRGFILISRFAQNYFSVRSLLAQNSLAFQQPSIQWILMYVPGSEAARACS
jgi:hypothetical protein